MFVNLTPHAIKIHGGPDVVTLAASGRSLRVAQEWERQPVVPSHDGVPLYRPLFGDVELVDNATKEVVGGLPPVIDGTLYIVSGQTLDAVKAAGRYDFAAPGELIRDGNGQPIGCNGLRV